MSIQKKKRGLAAWTTRDILVTAVIALVFGLLMAGYTYVSGSLLAIVGPIVGAINGGFFLLPGVFTIYILRRPGAAFLSMVLIGFAMLPLTAFGWVAITGQAILGVFVELPFIVTRYRKFDLPMLLISGVLINVVTTAILILRGGPGL